MTFLILIGIIVLILLYVMGSYNSLVKLRNMVEEGWSGIDVQLKRRYDLIPNLVETVKGYAAHENKVFEDVIKARNSAMNTSGVEDKAQAENMLSGTLKSLFALTENYPDLKANTNFLGLQDSLNEVEEKLQMARRYYNGTVRDYNIKCETFPSVIIANSFGFSKKEFFKINEEEKENVKIKF
ncbi:MAG: LemA family protein [Candidatus Muirbacterium halophilum]|nr:LemA family protein [Candidatus Muirbacterium halophilum]MCK9476495.1 LemA family protein [Candidatus Muirbacterium halophilum]